VSNSSTLKKQHSRNQRVTFDFEARFAEFPSIRMKHDKWQNSHGHSGNQLDKFRGPDSREAPPWLAQSGKTLKILRPQKGRKWHFQNLLYLFC
jgi:hypothetical protein